MLVSHHHGVADLAADLGLPCKLAGPLLLLLLEHLISKHEIGKLLQRKVVVANKVDVSDVVQGHW
jgi:hypothetical protein